MKRLILSLAILLALCLSADAMKVKIVKEVQCKESRAYVAMIESPIETVEIMAIGVLDVGGPQKPVAFIFHEKEFDLTWAALLIGDKMISYDIEDFLKQFPTVCDMVAKIKA